MRSFSVWLGGDGGWMAGIDELSGSCVHSLLVGWAVLVAGWLGLMSFQGAVSLLLVYCGRCIGGRVAEIDELSGSCVFASVELGCLSGRVAGIDELSLINELIYRVQYILGDAVGIDELSGSCAFASV